MTSAKTHSSVPGLWIGAIAGAVLLGVGVVLGAMLTGRGDAHPLDKGFLDFQETLLHASSASSGEHFAIATGAVDEDAEGIFVLDFQTGGLRCAVLNHRTGKFSGLFTANVTKDLGAAKNPKYEMVTGLVDFKRGSTPARPGLSVVYVLDSTNGNLVAYGVPWRRDGSANGRAQLGSLRPIDGMQVRNVSVRQH